MTHARFRSQTLKFNVRCEQKCKMQDLTLLYGGVGRETRMKLLVIALIFVWAGSAVGTTQSPYIGEASNEIKSLSPSEITDLLQGNGMGFAKAAELNRYPGPRHVLDLAEQLHLSSEQVAQTNRIFDRMRDKAVKLGTQLVEFERELDALFSAGGISAPALDALLLQIGETRAKLRGTHLQAHLEMKEILSRHQVMMYDELRGYSNGMKSHEHAL